MTPHLEELLPECQHFILRVWENPARLDPATLQPINDYDGVCVLTICDDECEIKAVKQLPDNLVACLRMIQKIARDRGWKRLWFQRWECGIPRIVEIAF